MAFILTDLLEQSCAAYPNKTALIYKNEHITFAQLWARVKRCAQTFRALGVVKGDRIIICAGNHPDGLVAFWSGLKIGAAVSVAAMDQPPAKLGFILRDSEARLLVMHVRQLEWFRDEIRTSPIETTLVVGDEVPEDEAGLIPFDTALVCSDGDDSADAKPIGMDIASIIYTSGSTGTPKGVVLTHRNMMAAQQSLQAYLQYRPDDVILCPLPISFDYGLYQAVLAAGIGATLVIEPEQQLPTALMRDIEQYRCTVIPGISTLYHLIYRYSAMGKFDFGSVRLVTNTGMALRPTHVQYLRHLFPDAEILAMYGLTECKRVTYLPPAEIDDRPESVGIAIPNTEITIVDDHDKPCPPGVVGQLVVRGETVMQGYWRNPGETAQKIRLHPVYGDRCLYTGDYGYLDEKAYFHFVGRSEDVIKLRGRKVVISEIEAALDQHDTISEVAVIVTDSHGESEIIAFYQSTYPLSFSELRAHCQSRLEPHQIPHRFLAMSSLAKTANGKIDKRRILAEYENVPSRYESA